MTTSKKPDLLSDLIRDLYNPRQRFVRAVGKTLLAASFVAVTACSDGDTKVVTKEVQVPAPAPEQSIPSADDPSAFGELVVGIQPHAALPDDHHETNYGTFEKLENGVRTFDVESAESSNVLYGAPNMDDHPVGVVFNVPSNSEASPLTINGQTATEFSQQMLRFEEFGTQALDLEATQPDGYKTLPVPANAQAAPDGAMLDDFLAQRIWPTPDKFANTVDTNPWSDLIETYLGRSLDADGSPIEGRPPGLGWSHQRWDEFTPTKYFKSAMAGSRVNGGLRDSMQSHGYTLGEFGPGGLYHNVAGIAATEGTAAGIPIKLHPNLPTQAKSALWTFDGTLPPKLLLAKYGETLLFRHHNALPVDVSENHGFGVHTITTHEHNGHNPAESDGYANAYYFPGQYYDYRWPMTIAGSDTINTDATDPRAGTPDGQGGITNIPGDWRETMSTHWFHDHMLDFTAQNVYKGNAAMMNYYSSLDRGKEDLEDGVNLRFPSGTAQDWGNRDYDVQLLIADKAWDSEGQLWFNPFNIRGFVGDIMTVNWLYKPYFDVRARQYRFRILNGSVSRFFKLALIDEAGNRVPFHMIANDGNVLEHAVAFDGTGDTVAGELPTQAIAERYDIIVDFSNYNAGDKLYMVNLLQHKDGQASDRPIPLEEITDGSYEANTHLVNNRWVDGDPSVGKILEFRVASYDGTDVSMNPADYTVGKKRMIDIRRPTEGELASARHRTFEFEKEPTDHKPWVIRTDGDSEGLTMDPRRITAAPTKNIGGLEIWRLINSGTWSHPIHIHFEEGLILRRNGAPPPSWEHWARKDVYRIGPQLDTGDVVELAIRFREFAGTYMEHCHNTQHEDHAMLMRWDLEHPGQTKLMPTPIPTWDGVNYVDSTALPTFRSGDGVGMDVPHLESMKVWVDGMVVGAIDQFRETLIGDSVSHLTSRDGGSTYPLEPDNERATATYQLTKATNYQLDGSGNVLPATAREVWFIPHDISDEDMADEMGLSWAGGLRGVNPAATAGVGDADFPSAAKVNGEWEFYGDVPNAVLSNPRCAQNAADLGFGSDPTTGYTIANANGELCANDPGADLNPVTIAANTYSPLRILDMDGDGVTDRDATGEPIVANFIVMKWGNEDYEMNRIDLSCSSLPDVPANSSCRYNGAEWGRKLKSGHVLALETHDAVGEELVHPYVTVKLHKSWTDFGDYLPYYVVLDSWPEGPAIAMGVPNVPRHEFLGLAGVPLVQFVPPARIDPTFPPFPNDGVQGAPNNGSPDVGDGFGVFGGGPFGSQVGLPSYFMPAETYSPMWHIGFAHWIVPAEAEGRRGVIHGLEELKELRAAGKIDIYEFPAPPKFASLGGTGGDYDFANPASPHIVNCPTPLTIDTSLHRAAIRTDHSTTVEDWVLTKLNGGPLPGTRLPANTLCEKFSGGYEGAFDAARPECAQQFVTLSNNQQ